jgi:hypothetical protein
MGVCIAKAEEKGLKKWGTEKPKKNDKKWWACGTRLW